MIRGELFFFLIGVIILLVPWLVVEQGFDPIWHLPANLKLFVMIVLAFYISFLPCILQLEFQYFHDHATFTTAAALNQSPAIDVTATIGTPTIAFGAEAGYDTTSGSFTKYTAGISVTKPDSYASIIL